MSHQCLSLSFIFLLVFERYSKYSKVDVAKAIDLELKGDIENLLISVGKLHCLVLDCWINNTTAPERWGQGFDPGWLNKLAASLDTSVWMIIFCCLFEVHLRSSFLFATPWHRLAFRGKNMARMMLQCALGQKLILLRHLGTLLFFFWFSVTHGDKEEFKEYPANWGFYNILVDMITSHDYD